MLLDAKIRDCVLLPIFLVVILMQALRSNIMTILKSDAKVDTKELKTNNMLQRCRALRAQAHLLHPKAFFTRKAYFVKKDQGVLVKNPPKPKDPTEMLSGGGGDPMAMMGHMKGQVMYMVSQGLVGYWVSHLFSGFLVAKTPFPLTFQFKAMTQRGVEVQALEPDYVSSLCWYMFVLVSSHSVLSIIQSLFFNSEVEEDDPMMAMMGSMSGAAVSPMGGPDMSKVFKQEQESLEMIQHEFVLGTPGATDGIEVELWRKWKAERHA